MQIPQRIVLIVALTSVVAMTLSNVQNAVKQPVSMAGIEFELPDILGRNVSSWAVSTAEAANATPTDKVDINQQRRQTQQFWISLDAFRGRLGNYMMQHSSALGLLQQLPPNSQLCLTTKTLRKRSSIHSYFHGPFPQQPCPSFNESDTTYMDWVEVEDHYQADLVAQHTNCSTGVCVFRMSGFWSSHRYFSHIRNDLRRVWNLTDLHYTQAMEFVKDDENTTSYVGIHIRRTDMAKVEAYTLPSMEYYHQAMQYYRDKFNSSAKLHFWVASDDKRRCRNEFDNVTDARVLPDALSAAVEMGILSHCRGVILSVGTFGWWGAHLSESFDAVYPLESYQAEYWKTRLGNHLPDEWTGI